MPFTGRNSLGGHYACLLDGDGVSHGGSRKPYKWTPTMDARVRALWQTTSRTAIAREIGVSPSAVYHRARGVLLLPRVNWKKRTQPSKAEWVKAASDEAKFSGLRTSEVISGRTYPAALARWRAYKTILDTIPSVSIAGLARVAGFDHTAVMHGLRRLSGASVNEIRASRSIGRRVNRSCEQL